MVSDVFHLAQRRDMRLPNPEFNAIVEAYLLVSRHYRKLRDEDIRGIEGENDGK